MKKYAPLVVVELYLLFTIAFYNFGVVNFDGHNDLAFIFLMVLYHVSFISGYIFFSLVKPKSIAISNYMSSSFFYLAFILGIFGVLNTYKNLMLSPSLVPYDLLSEVGRGFSEPGAVYAARMEQVLYGDGVSGSRLLNITSFFFSFFKLLFIFIFLFHWKDLGFFKKSLSILYSFLFLSGGIASGTNSVVFIFFIFVFFSIVVIMYVKNYRHFNKIFLLGCLFFLIPIGMFGFIMSQRGGGFDYFVGTSPLGDISILAETPSITGIFDFYYYSFVWLNYYLVQGYYGFSLILDMDLNWTYGFGNSAFLQRQFLLLTGIDITDLTFQSRISHFWDANAQWHSFYGQFANDFGFIGLSILMFVLGGFLCRVWMSIIFNNSFYGAALMPIFILMFVFFPANNQVFGYIDTLSYFMFVSVFWFFEINKKGFTKYGIQ